MSKETQILRELGALKKQLSQLEQRLIPDTSLGFGKRAATPEYLFINFPNNSAVGEGAYWYTRNPETKLNTAIFEPELRCIVKTLYRRDRRNAAGKNKPVLELHLRADKDYVLMAGTFYGNLAASLLAALAQVPAAAMKDALTLKLEHSKLEGHHRAVFAQIYLDGVRVTRTPDVSKNKALLQTLHKRYGFVNPLTQDIGLGSHVDLKAGSAPAEQASVQREPIEADTDHDAVTRVFGFEDES